MDARIVRTQKAIKSSWLQLSQENQDGKITITAICKRAHINRASFYRYYASPEALAEAIEEDIFDELSTKLETAKESNPNDCFSTILRFLLDRRETLQVLSNNRSTANLDSKLKTLCFDESAQLLEARFPTYTEAQRYALFCFIFEGWMGIVDNWIDKGAQEDPDQIVSFANEIIMSINENLPKDSKN